MSLFRTLCFASIVSSLAMPACDNPQSSDASIDDVVDRRDATDGAPVDASLGCLAAGTASVSVSLEIAPGLEVPRDEIWIAAMCIVDGQERAVRVVRAQPDGVPTEITGLGTGAYVIRASTMVAQGVASGRLDVREGSTSITSLILAPGSAPIARLQTSTTGTDAGSDASSDAAVPDDVFDAATSSDASSDGTAATDATDVDAAIPEADAGVGGILFVRPVTSVDTGQIVGTAVAVLQPHDGASFDATLFVQAANCGARGCQSISLDSVEWRTDRSGEPLDYAAAGFDVAILAPGQIARSTPRTLTGSITDAYLGFGFAAFGVPMLDDAGTARDR